MSRIRWGRRMDQQISDIRAFNRFYTGQIGLLEEHIVRSRFTLPEARLLYEIGTRGHTTGAELSRALGIDPAQVSRMVWKLVDAGLIVLTPDAGDRRSNRIALSGDGDAAFAELNAGSDAAVASMVAHLSPPGVAELVAAMRTIRRLLRDDVDDGPVIFRPHRIGELGWLIHRQGVLYNRQFGWNIEFEALIARIYAEFEQAPDDPPKALWVAEQGGRVVGSVFLLPSTTHPGFAQLRMLYVEPEARGAGLGRALVDQCVRFARERGYAGVRLWTQQSLVSARRIYAAAGFELVDSAPHRSFGNDLVGEHWQLAFGSGE
ncbi:MAG TPA: helix-turn-helix domain-containing GNAT family N-acetyltransferase [Alphaproteobacteria bacterium]|nr:helix-turn-helix domain-containing GNAT family N-acetyltransferase [Alphaproteobacteria bacterium]